MKIGFAALGAALLGVASPALAAGPTYTINTVGSSTSLDGTYGNKLPGYLSPTVSGSGLLMQVTAWQQNQTTNAITTAYLGAYSVGLGVTGVNDFNGAYNLHQIDDTLGYNDFLLLEFNKPVVLTGATIRSYDIPFLARDNDMAWVNAGALTSATWDGTPTNWSALGLTAASWNGVWGDGSDGARTIDNTAASTKWLIGAANFTKNGVANDLDDGFKLVSVNVAAAVPEPASWAMLIAGFAMIGTMMRAFRRSDERFTERMNRLAAGDAA